MKKFLKIFGVTIMLIVAVISVTLCVFLIATNNVTLQAEKLVSKGYNITFYDSQGEKILPSDGFSAKTVQINELPDYVGKAFIAVEDKRFYSHNGVDLRALVRATLNDIKCRSPKEGGSTISQQLVKNTHLSNEKTLLRKAKEVRLALRLEKKYSKDQILNFYLNGIYFGNGAYGVESAANRYFSKQASDLTVSEAAALAATVKSPSKYNPLTKEGEKRRNLVLKLMLEQEYIGESDYLNAIAEKITVKEKIPQDYFALVKNELYDVCDFSPYEQRPIEVYTYFDKKAQNALSSLSEKTDKVCKNGLIASLSGHVKAVIFPNGDQKRMPASTIKPLAVYAPAFNEGLVSPLTLIDDSPTTFGDYSPKNYGDIYYGYTSVKDCIIKSLNIPAVKLFDALGGEKCIEYANKTGLDIHEKTLNVALGGFESGVSFTSLCGAYTVFKNGEYHKPKFIKSVRIGRLSLYSANDEGVKVFKNGTVDLINDSLKECAKNGTAKALSCLPFDVCAKTGTNGNEKGNTDALVVCYTSEDIIGVRLSAEDGLMPSSVTGGMAASEAVEIIERLYADRKPANIEQSDETIEKRICKLAYADGKILLAPTNQPDRYCVKGLFMKEYEPSQYSQEYTHPTAVASIEKKENNVTLHFQKHSAVGIEIYKKTNDDENKIADTNNCDFTDERLKDGRYAYYYFPYTLTADGKRMYGEKRFIAEVYVGEKQRFIDEGCWYDD